MLLAGQTVIIVKKLPEPVKSCLSNKSRLRRLWHDVTKFQAALADKSSL